jgi:hypothetical protein
MQWGSTVDKIIDTLGERSDQAREQVGAILEVLGESRTLELLEETLRIEAGGGMTVSDGSRRRTPGGVFFHLARRWLPPRERKRIFQWQPVGEDTPPSEGANIHNKNNGVPALAPAPEPSTSAPLTSVRGPRPLRGRIVTSLRKPVEPTPAPPSDEAAAPVAGNDVSKASQEAPPAARRRRIVAPPVRRIPVPADVSTESSLPEPMLPPTPGLGTRGIRAARRGVPGTRTAATPAALPAPKLALGLGSDFDERVQDLVAQLVSDLVPLLQRALVESIRSALGGASPGQRPVEPTPAARRRSARSDGVRSRALELIGAEPGITTADLSVRLYGNDAAATRAKTRSLVWKLEREGVVRRVGTGSYALA